MAGIHSPTHSRDAKRILAKLRREAISPFGARREVKLSSVEAMALVKAFEPYVPDCGCTPLMAHSPSCSEADYDR